MIEKIEQNTFGHFKYLPKLAGFSVNQNTVPMIINCDLGSSMFNIACGVLDGEHELDQKIQHVISEFNGQPFAWWMPSSAQSGVLHQKLLEQGLIIETTEYAMICDLNDFEGEATGLEFKQVETVMQREHFIQVLEPYDAAARLFYEKLTMPMLQNQENLFVGYENDDPVVIGILFYFKDTAGIFTLLTKEEKRRRGYGENMMIHLMKTAKAKGARYSTLYASSDSGYRLYERLGFKKIGQIECFEWKAL